MARNDLPQALGRFIHPMAGKIGVRGRKMAVMFSLFFLLIFLPFMAASSGAGGKESACQCTKHETCGFDSWIQKNPWRRAWQPTPVFLPGESHGQRNQAGYSPWGHKESDTTEAT